MNSKTFLRNSVVFLLFLVPIFPLIVADNLFFPFITGKAFFFRIVVEMAFFLWIILAYRDRQYAPRWNAMTIGVTVFALVALVADLFGYNPIRSLWSNNERMEGWLEIVHCWAYFIVLVSVFRDRKWWPRYFNMTIAVAIVIALYGVAQLLGSSIPWFAAHFPIHQGSSRLDASLGNSEYLAVYMLFHAFLAAYLAVLAWGKRTFDRVWVYSALAALFTFILFETETRGTELGIVGGALLALVLYAVWPRQAAGDARSSTSRLVSGGIAALLVLLGVGFYFGRNISWIRDDAMVGRLASISLTDTTVASRLDYIWPMAIKGAFSSPKTAVIGWGQENFNYIFNADYSPHMWDDEQWFDRAHDVFLDWLVAGGLLAFLSYLSLYVLSLWLVWRSGLSVAEKSIFTGMIAGYAVHNVFVFDNLASYYLFFLSLGFAYSLRDSRGFARLESGAPDNEVANYVVLPFAVIALLAALYFINVRPIEANTDLIAGLEDCSSGQTSVPSVVPWQTALAVNAYVANQEIREQLLSCADSVISSQAVDGSTKEDFFTLVNAQVEKQIAATPNDARIYTLAGGFYNDIGQFSLSLPLLEKAHELSPGKQTIDFALALAEMNTGSTTEGVALFKQAYQSDTAYPDAAVNYAAALISTGDEADAAPILAENPAWQTDSRIIGAYVSGKDYSKAISIYKGLIAGDESDVQYRVSLAAVYYEEKDIPGAVAVLDQAIADFPLYKAQLQNIIDQIEGVTPAASGASDSASASASSDAASAPAASVSATAVPVSQ